jgi:hypothetical protein
MKDVVNAQTAYTIFVGDLWFVFTFILGEAEHANQPLRMAAWDIH